MKRKSQYLIVLFTSAILLAARFVTGQGYYPVNTGNRWEYWDIIGQEYLHTIFATGDTVLPNGKQYTILESDVAPGNLGFIRQSGSKVYRYYPAFPQELLVYDFSKTIGDTVAINEYPGDGTVITVVSDETVEVFGKMRRQWGFWAQEQNSSAYTFTKVADSVGVRWSTGEAYPYDVYLVGASIDGTIYGTLFSEGEFDLTYDQQYKLHQNYPNPFNPVTHITFRLPSRSYVSLKVFDALGREVATLASEELPAGTYSRQWDAAGLASGVYFYRLQAGSFIETRKLILLR